MTCRGRSFALARSTDPGDVDHFTLCSERDARMERVLRQPRPAACRGSTWTIACAAFSRQPLTRNSAGKGYFLTNDEQLTWGEFQGEVVRAVGQACAGLEPSGASHVGVGRSPVRSQLESTRSRGILNLQKARLGAQQAWTCVGDAARRDFGFTAEVDLIEGIRSHARVVPRQRLVSEPRPRQTCFRRTHSAAWLAASLASGESLSNKRCPVVVIWSCR